MFKCYYQLKGAETNMFIYRYRIFSYEYKFASTPFMIECKNRGEGVNKYKIKVVDKYVMY